MKKNAFLFLLSFILISCESEEVVVDEEHTDADGFILEYNEEEVYKEFAGAIVTNNVTVAVGQEIELAVHFLDDEGNEIEHSDDDDQIMIMIMVMTKITMKKVHQKSSFPEMMQLLLLFQQNITKMIMMKKNMMMKKSMKMKKNMKNMKKDIWLL